MANLPLVEKLLCERYNVRSLDGPLKEAIDAGDVTSLQALIADRDMYRWSKDIQAALKAPAETPVSRMVKRDLVATATEREVEVAPDATVADLREALTAEPEEEPVEEEPTEEPTRSSRPRK
jgi:hypothetical protein